MTATAEQISEQIETADWEAIKPHVLRDAVVIVDKTISLVDAGMKVVHDDVETVTEWLQNNKLSKPSKEQFERWEAHPSISFRFVILQPYVLIQEQAH